MLAALLLALFLPGPRQRPRRPILKLVASSLWTLEHLCTAMASVMREWPELEEIRIDLGALSMLDEACVAPLSCATQAAATAGVELWLDGCDARMAAFLRARGVRLRLGSLRGTPDDWLETRH